MAIIAEAFLAHNVPIGIRKVAERTILHSKSQPAGSDTGQQTPLCPKCHFPWYIGTGEMAYKMSVAFKAVGSLLMHRLGVSTKANSKTIFEYLNNNKILC